MKTYKIVKFAVFVALAISIIFLKEVYVENLRYFIGALITMYGVDEGLSFIFNKDDRAPSKMAKCLVQVILGVSTMIWFDNFESVCVIWAVWSIMRETGEIAEIYELFKERIPFLLSLTESVVSIVFSIMLIIEPGEHHAMTHMYLLIVELLTAVIFPQLIALYCKHFKKEEQILQK